MAANGWSEALPDSRERDRFDERGDRWDAWAWDRSDAATEWTQRLTRSRGDGGSERLDGWLRIALPAGRRAVPLHLPVYPPMPWVPEMEFEPESGPDVDVSVVAAFRQGIRLEIRRLGNADTDEELILHIELVAE